jgi:hypothetical protein
MTTPTADQLRASIAEAEQAYDVERDHARTAAKAGDREKAARHDTAANLAGDRLGQYEDQLHALQAQR